MTELLNNTVNMVIEAAPWLLLGLVAAGLIKAWLPTDFVARRLGKSGMGSVGTAALLGAPLPLCSCGVVPAALSLRKAGASRGATASFLVSTPETGVDSIAMTYAMLGPLMAVIRPFAALFSAITAGLLVNQLTSTVQEKHASDTPNGQSCCADANDGCCSSAETDRSLQNTPTTADAPTSCCNSSAPSSPPPGILKRTQTGLSYAFTSLLDDISAWLAAGLLVAGIIITLVPPSTLASWGSGPVAMLLILLIAIPMYVCATASTPLAHAMLFAGVSPGTVLVFLLAGPATNFASLGVIKNMIGLRGMIGYLIGVCGSAMALGLMLDWAWLYWGLEGFQLSAEAHAHDASHWIGVFSAVVLTVAAIRPLRRRLVALFVGSGKADDNSCCNS